MARLDMSELILRAGIRDPHFDSTEEAQRLIAACDSDCAVDHAILCLLGAAIRLGRDRVRDWDPTKALKLAEEYVGTDFEYDTDMILSLE
jgi:hypothetical protein